MIGYTIIIHAKSKRVVLLHQQWQPTLQQDFENQTW